VFSADHKCAGYRFGAFEVDTAGREIRKQGVRVRVQHQSYEVLLELLEHADEVVSREQIRRRLWGDDTHVDFDNAINSAVRKLRHALRDDAETPRYIETLSRRGYRFIAAVSTYPAGAPVTPPLVTPISVVLPVRSKGAKPSWKTLSYLLAGGFLVGLGCLAWLKMEHSPDASANLRAVPLTSNRGRERQPSFSPDGTRIAYVWDGGDGRDPGVYTKLIGAGEPVRLAGSSAGAFSPAWSPDGRWIAVLEDSGQEWSVSILPASGGQPRELKRLRVRPESGDSCVTNRCGAGYGGSLLAWSPDGRLLYTSGRAVGTASPGIVRISVETGDWQPITSPHLNSESDVAPAVSPDGRWLAFVRVSGEWNGDLYLVALSEDPLHLKPVQLTKDSAYIGAPVWMPGGNQLVFSSDRTERRELWSIRPSQPLRPHRLYGIEQGVLDIAVSRNGRLAYARTVRSSRIWGISLDSRKHGDAQPLTHTTSNDISPRFSPDGQRLVFMSNRTGVDQLWAANADGSNPTQLTRFEDGKSGSPDWSPDGTKIAFDRFAAGNYQIYIMDSGGGGIRQLTHSAGDSISPTWSREGQWIYFASKRSDRLEIYRTLVGGSQEVQVTTEGGLSAVESSDRKYLLYKSQSNGPLWRMPINGGGSEKLLDRVNRRSFVVNQKGIYYLSGEETAQELRYFEFASGKSRAILGLPGVIWADVSRDERTLVYSQPQVWTGNLMLVENFR
jgi:Tol biopolymer transport system component/DNA-binding winged helix-turn-helix (wHTH) protein